MNSPKPFHVGTRVRVDAPDCEACSVRYVEDEQIRVVYGDDTRVWHNKQSLVHADDGSPLGEWVPINPDGELVHRWEDPKTGEEVDLRTINVQDANRIIRGEAEQ